MESLAMFLKLNPISNKAPKSSKKNVVSKFKIMIFMVRIRKSTNSLILGYSIKPVLQTYRNHYQQLIVETKIYNQVSITLRITKGIPIYTRNLSGLKVSQWIRRETRILHL